MKWDDVKLRLEGWLGRIVVDAFFFSVVGEEIYASLP